MDDVMKKRVLIGIVVGCIALAVIITVATNRYGSSIGTRPSGRVTLMCAKCGNIFELSSQDVRKNDLEMRETTGPPTFECPKCHQKSAYIAIKCAKCSNVFMPTSQDIKNYGRCPKCGYSEYEESEKK
jgi:DNA-directed RNA polymerase subunit M/transcription elongation factor TFIIS